MNDSEKDAIYRHEISAVVWKLTELLRVERQRIKTMSGLSDNESGAAITAALSVSIGAECVMVAFDHKLTKEERKKIVESLIDQNEKISQESLLCMVSEIANTVSTKLGNA